ncbi:MAG: hypothetical protein SGI72_06040 [Planctomycetota bacterium]|nr:hypothetical protein [Planctomycetota bacterium]
MLESDASSRPRVARYIFALALVVALVRFVRLSHWSLWLDEALTWTDWHIGLEGGEIHNPAGYALIAWAVKMCGGVPDEFALRILPATVGFLCVPLTWFAFRRFAGELRASCTALLLAASSWHVYWSQNARFYTLAQACTLIGTGLLLSAYLRGSTVRAFLGLATIAAGAAFHPSVVFLLPAVVLAPFVMRALGVPLADPARRVAKHCLFAGVLAALVGAKWAYDAWRTYVIQKGIQADAADSSAEVWASVGHYLKTTGFFVTPLVFTGVLCGVWFAWKRREREGLFVAIVVILCLAAALVAALIVKVAAQYVFFLLPWILLLACTPLARDRATPEPRLGGAVSFAFVTLLLLPTLVTTGLYMTVRRGERPQWRDAYDFVWNERRDGDLVLGMHATVGEYYLSPRATDLRFPIQVGWLDWFHTFDAKTWSKYPRRAWFVVNPEEFYDWKPDEAAAFQRMLREECRLVKAYPLYVESRDLSVWVYLRGG